MSDYLTDENLSGALDVRGMFTLGGPATTARTRDELAAAVVDSVFRSPISEALVTLQGAKPYDENESLRTELSRLQGENERLRAERHSIMLATMQPEESIYPRVDKAVERINQWRIASLELAALREKVTQIEQEMREAVGSSAAVLDVCLVDWADALALLVSEKTDQQP